MSISPLLVVMYNRLSGSVDDRSDEINKNKNSYSYF